MITSASIRLTHRGLRVCRGCLPAIAGSGLALVIAASPWGLRGQDVDVDVDVDVDAEAAEAAADPGNEKALKYHEVLVGRPSAGYLYDRFFGAWLETGTVESLEGFLRERGTGDAAATGDRLLLAFFYTKQGEDAKALEVFAEALEADPGNAEAWLEKARAEARSLDFDAALDDLEQADGAESDDDQAAEIAKLRGRLLVRAGRSEEALEVWRGLLADRPDDEDLYEDIIELQVDEGLYDEAIATAATLAEATTDPYQQVQRQLVVGDLYQRSGNREQALDAYSTSLGKTGHGTWIEKEILAQIEQMFRREDDIEGLAGYLEQLLAEDERRLALRERHAGALAELGEEELAIEAWQSILELTPGQRAVRENFVAVLARMERFDEAVEQMRALSELHPEDGELKVALAELHHAAGDGAAAGAAVTAFLEGSDGSEYAYLRAARLLERFELAEQAEAVYRELLAEYPDSVGARETFANFLFVAKRRDEALAIWRELADTDDVAAVVRVGRALLSRGEVEEAYALMHERYDELKGDSAYLSQLIELALRAKRSEQAFDWVRRRLVMAESSEELVDVTGQARLVVRQTGEAEERVEALRSEVQGGDGPAIREICLLAELLSHLGDDKAAHAELDAAVAAESTGDEDKLLALAQQARLFSLSKDWTGAAEVLRQAVELPGGRKSSNVQMLVDLYQRSLQIDEALHWIGEWKTLSPGSSAPWLREASLRLGAGQIDESLKTLRSAVRRFDDSEEVRLQLAEALVDSGKIADAERVYWQLYDEAEDSLAKLNWAQRLGELAADTGRIEHVVERFEERKRQNRGSVVPLLALAEIYQADDRYEERRQVILEASRLQPDDVGLLHQLASIDEAEGDIAGALESLEAALEVDATGRSRQRIVRLHFLSGEYEKAFETLQSGQQGGLAATDPYLLEEVFSGIIRVGEWARGADFLRPFLSAHPENYRLHYLYAVALEEDEQYERAWEAFVHLLGLDEELPPPPNQAGGSQQRRYVMYAGSYYSDEAQLEQAKRDMEQMYPAGAIEMQLMNTAGHRAYHYRQGRGEGRIYGFSNNGHYRGGWMGGYGSSNLPVMPPATVADVGPFAFSHLMRIGEKLADAGGEAKGIDEQLTEAAQRFDLPPLYLEWRRLSDAAEKGPEEEQGRVFSRLMQAHPDSDVVNALWCMGWAGRGEGVDLLAEARQVYEHFRESRPALALVAATSAAMLPLHDAELADEDRERASALLSEGLELGQQIDFTPMVAYQQVFNLVRSHYQIELNGGNAGGVESPLSEEQLTSLHALLERWEEEVMERYGNDQNAAYMKMSVLYLKALQGDLEALFAGLQAEIERFREQLKGGGGADPALPYGDPYSGSNAVVIKLTFPPATLPDLPPAVSAFLASNLGRYYRVDGWLPEERVAELVDLLPTLEDPLVRALAAHRAIEAGADGEASEPIFEAAMEELVALDPPTASALVMVAAREANAEEPDLDRATEMLDRARYLAKTESVSRYLDGALMHLGQDADEGSPAFERGKAAALRMRALIKPDEHSQLRQLADVLRDFGLDREAASLSLLVARAQTAQSQGSTSGAGMQVQTAMQDPEVVALKLTQLVEQGKRDAAVKTGVTQIKLIATGLLGENASNMEYQLRELREAIAIASLADELVAAAVPEPDAKLVERVQFAALCEVVGANEQATAAYRELIEERPQDDAIRLRLVLLLASEDIDAALALLEEGESGDIAEQVGSIFSQRLNNVASFDDYFNIAESALRFIEARKSDLGDHRMHWIESIRGELAGDVYVDNMRLPSLTVKWEREDYTGYDGYSEKRFDEMLARRDAMHERYCQVMMEMPVLAPLGFAYHEVVRREAGADSAELAALARKVLMTMEQPAFIGNGYALMPTHSSYSSGGSDEKQLEVRGPIETLVSHAHAGNDRALIYDEVLPELEKDEDRAELAAAVRQHADLYFCAPEDFGDAFEGLLTVTSRHGQRFALRIAVDAYEDRGVDFDLSPIVAEFITDTKQRHSGMENMLPRLIAAIGETQGEETGLKLFETYATEMLGPGPAERRQEYVRKHYKPSSWSSGTPNGDIHDFEEFLSACGDYPRLVFPAVRYAAETGISKHGRIYKLEYVFTNRGHLEQPGFVRDWVSSSPLVQPMANFDPISALGFQRISQQGKSTVIGQMLGQLEDLEGEARQPVQEIIAAADGKVPFGLRLVQARWKDNPSLESLKVFHQASAEIAALPEERQVLLAALAADLVDANKLPSNLDTSLRESWQLFEQLAGATAEDQVNDFLAAESAADLGIRDYHLDDHAEALIKRLMSQDVEQAVAVFGKAVELIEASSYRSSYSGGRTFDGQLLDSITREAPPLALLEFEARLTASETIPPVSIFTRPKFANMARKLLEGWDGQRAEREKERLRKLFADCSTRLEGVGSNAHHGAALAGPLFFEIGNVIGPDYTDWLIQWLGGAEATLRDSELALHAGMALRQAAAVQAFNALPQEQRSVEWPLADAEADAHYQAVIADSGLPAVVRLMTASFCLVEGTPFASDDLVRAASQLLVESWSGEIPVVDGQAMLVIKAWQARPEAEQREQNAAGLSSAFQLRYLSGRAPRRLQSEPEQQVILAMLRLNLDNGNPAMANQLLSRFDQQLGSYTAPFIDLVEAGEFASAARLLRRDTQKVGAVDDGSEGSRWSAEWQAATAAFLETVPRTETRLLAHAVLASIPDPEDKAVGNGETRRAERLGAVAAAVEAAVADGQLDNVLAAEQILGILAVEPQAATFAPEAFRQAVERVPVDAVFSFDDSNLRDRKLALLDAGWLQSLMRGEAEPFASGIVAAAAAPSRSSYYKTRFLHGAVKLPYRALEAVDYDPEIVLALLPAWSRLLREVPMSQDIGSPNYLMGRLIFAFAETDQLDRFYAWLDEHGEEERAELIALVRQAGSGFYNTAANYCEAQERGAEERMALLQRWLQREEVLQTGVGFGWSNLIAAVKPGMITIDQIIELGPSAAEVTPRRGYAWADVGMAHNRKSQFAEALPMWQRALEIAEAEKRTQVANRFRLGIGNTLEKLERLDEARAAIEGITKQQLSNTRWKELDGLRKRLKMEALANPNAGQG